LRARNSHLQTPDNQTGKLIERQSTSMPSSTTSNTPPQRNLSFSNNAPSPSRGWTASICAFPHTSWHTQPPGNSYHHVLKNVGESALLSRPMFSTAFLVST